MTKEIKREKDVALDGNMIKIFFFNRRLATKYKTAISSGHYKGTMPKPEIARENAVEYAERFSFK